MSAVSRKIFIGRLGVRFDSEPDSSPAAGPRIGAADRAGAQNRSATLRMMAVTRGRWRRPRRPPGRASREVAVAPLVGAQQEPWQGQTEDDLAGQEEGTGVVATRSSPETSRGPPNTTPSAMSAAASRPTAIARGRPLAPRQVGARRRRRPDRAHGDRAPDERRMDRADPRNAVAERPGQQLVDGDRRRAARSSPRSAPAEPAAGRGRPRTNATPTQAPIGVGRDEDAPRDRRAGPTPRPRIAEGGPPTRDGRPGPGRPSRTASGGAGRRGRAQGRSLTGWRRRQPGCGSAVIVTGGGGPSGRRRLGVPAPEGPARARRRRRARSR